MPTCFNDVVKLNNSQLVSVSVAANSSEDVQSSGMASPQVSLQCHPSESRRIEASYDPRVK